MVQPLWKTLWQFLKMLSIELSYDPAIPLLATYPRKINSYVHTKTCTGTFIAALFIITNKWKQPKCPSPDEWINKIWYMYTIEYYSATKKRMKY